MHHANDTFGELVKQYMQRHRLSYQDVTDKLGYKSKTSISRIIQSETSYELRFQFFKRMSECCPLSVQESTAFRDALHSSRLSASDQLFFRSFDQLLLSNWHSSPQEIPYLNNSRLSTSSLSSLLAQRCAFASQITISLFGVPHAHIIASLFHLLHESSTPFIFRHYVFTGEDQLPLLHAIAACTPYLFDSRYSLLHCPSTSGGALLTHHLLIHCETKDERLFEDLFLLDSERLPVHTALNDADLSSLYFNYFLSCVPNKPKDDISLDHQVQTYLNAQIQLNDLERDCACCSLSAAPSIEFVPPDLFSAVLNESISPSLYSHALYSRIKHIQKNRHMRLLSGKRPMHYLFSQNTFHRFIRTGRLDGHPSFLRLFTPKERLEILLVLMTQLEENPYFSIRFTTEAFSFPLEHASIVCCHHLHHASSHHLQNSGGFLLLPGYDVRNTNRSTVLSDPRITAAFSQYYQEELIPQYAYSQKSSQRILNSMLDSLLTISSDP